MSSGRGKKSVVAAKHHINDISLVNDGSILHVIPSKDVNSCDDVSLIKKVVHDKKINMF